MYYNFRSLELKNKLFNFIVTPRSAGKTVAMKCRGIEKYLCENKRFVYIRRRGVEITNKKLTGFYEKIQSLGFYSDKKLKYEGGLFYCDNEIIGYAVALSTGINERSVDFVNVSDIYFEEFVLSPDSHHTYLDDEVMKFLDMYYTIAREDEVKVWFLGNKLQEFNPYFLYFGINPPSEGIKIWKDFGVEIWQDKNFVQCKKKSRFGQLVDGTTYSEYAIENQGYTNNLTFKRKLPKRSTPIVGVVHNKKIYTIYICLDGSIQLDCNTPPNKLQVVCLDVGESTPTITPIKYYRDTPIGKLIIGRIKQNKFYHTNEKAEEIGNMVKKAFYFR